MNRTKFYISLAFILACALFGGGLYAGYRFFTPKAPAAGTQVNAQAILTALHDRGFLVTQTYVFDEPVTINKSTGSALKDFFFGQTITARGTMEVNLGIDLANVSSSDVTVTDTEVDITVPHASLFNTRLVGEINLQNNQGVLKKLFNSDDGYNEALDELTKVAEQTAERPELLAHADDSAKDYLSQLLGYVAKGKTIKLTMK